MLAPLVLFVYNRPQHTRACLDSLEACQLAKQSELLVFADAAPLSASAEEREAVQATRALLEEKWHFAKLKIYPREQHLGLAQNIVQGLHQVFATYPRAIILEDDLLFAPHILTYFNEALAYYEQEEKVMHINGYVPPMRGIHLPETFFYRAPFTWAWATWARAWQHFEYDLASLVQRLEARQMMAAFDLDNSGIFRNHIEANLSGKMHTWAIRWQASIFLKEGLCLTPAKSLSQNIGFDGSGTNCPNTANLFYHGQLSSGTQVEKIPLEEHKKFRKALRRFYHFGGLGIKVIWHYYGQKIRRKLAAYLPKSLKNFYRSVKSITFGLEQ